MILAILVGVQCYLIVIFICISLMIYAVEYLFISLFSSLISSLVEFLLRSLVHFLIGLFIFLLLSFKSSLHILGNRKFILKMISQEKGFIIFHIKVILNKYLLMMSMAVFVFFFLFQWVPSSQLNSSCYYLL